MSREEHDRGVGSLVREQKSRVRAETNETKAQQCSRIAQQFVSSPAEIRFQAYIPREGTEVVYGFRIATAERRRRREIHN